MPNNLAVTSEGFVRARCRLRSARLAVLFATLTTSLNHPSQAQDLEQAFRRPWSLFIFVSTSMPHQALVLLAREAAAAHATLVFRGFPNGHFDLMAEQRLVASLNEECCGVPPGAAEVSKVAPSDGAARRIAPSWSVDPVLYQRYAISAVPTFVLAESGNAGEQTFTKVSGDMALASALKYVAQNSSVSSRRAAAASIYQAAFGGKE